MLLKSGVDGMSSGAGFKFKIADEDKMMLDENGNLGIYGNDIGVEQSISMATSEPLVSVGREAGNRTMLLKSGIDGMASGSGFKFKIAGEDKMMLDENGIFSIGGRIEMVNTGHSVYFGEDAGNNDDYSSFLYNVGIGRYSLSDNTSGFRTLQVEPIRFSTI